MTNKEFGLEAAMRKSDEKRSHIAEDSRKVLEALISFWEVLAKKPLPNLALDPEQLSENIRLEAPLDCATDFEEAFLGVIGGLSGDASVHKRALRPSMRLAGRYEKCIELRRRSEGRAVQAATVRHAGNHASDIVLKDWFEAWRVRHPEKSLSGAAQHAVQQAVVPWTERTIYNKLRKIAKTLQSA